MTHHMGGRPLLLRGALALIVALFLDWYSVDLVRPATGGVDGWSAFELTDVLLAGAAILTLLAAVGGLAPGVRLPAVSAVALTGAGFGALLLVAVNLVDKPPFVAGVPDVSLEAGAWIALAGALLMALGALLRDARVALVVTPRERPSRPARPADETETDVLRQP
mgnify:CR=1 FL=1